MQDLDQLHRMVDHGGGSDMVVAPEYASEFPQELQRGFLSPGLRLVGDTQIHRIDPGEHSVHVVVHVQYGCISLIYGMSYK